MFKAWTWRSLRSMKPFIFTAGGTELHMSVGRRWPHAFPLPTSLHASDARDQKNRRHQRPCSEQKYSPLRMLRLPPGKMENLGWLSETWILPPTCLLDGCGRSQGSSLPLCRGRVGANLKKNSLLPAMRLFRH